MRVSEENVAAICRPQSMKTAAVTSPDLSVSLYRIIPRPIPEHSGLGGLVVSMLASGTQVRGFKPGRSRRIFSGVKILSMPSSGREVKPWVPCRRFAAW
jgi:hypothetical protein